MSTWEAINASRSRQLVFFGGGLLQAVVAITIAIALYPTSPRAAILAAVVVVVAWNIVSATLLRRWRGEGHRSAPPGAR